MLSSRRSILIGVLAVYVLAGAAAADDDVAGFRDMKWGDRASSHEGLARTTRGDRSFSRKNNENLAVLGVQSREINYYFDGKDGGLNHVRVAYARDESLCAKLEKALTVIYGDPDAVDERNGEVVRIWMKKTGSIALLCSPRADIDLSYFKNP